MKRILLEAVLVSVAGAAIAFAANALSPRGLSLTKNYFPGATIGTVAAPITASVTPAAGTNSASPAQLVAARIRELGFQTIDRTKAVELFKDPLFSQNLILFVDARDAAHFREGHIPGALEFDPYRPEQQLGTVIPACQSAEKIVVYCNGGDCEDSLFATIILRDAGISNPKLFIYSGGFQEWTTNGLPVELGERNSGQLRAQNP